MCARSLPRSLLKLITVFCTLSFPVLAQEQDTVYSLTAFVGGGYTRNFSGFERIPGLDSEPDRNGMSGFVRVMWTPEHLLSVGLETGIARVYAINAKGVQTSFGGTDFSSVLNVVPLSLSFSMHLTKRLEGYIASTSYFLFSHTRSFGSSVYGTMISIGFSATLSYMWPIDDDWSVGCEIKWYHIEKSMDDNGMIQVVVSYQFLEW
jgi:hypothetical protein